MNNAGISMREFGPTTFLIDAVPQIFGQADIGELLGDLLKQMGEEKTFHGEQSRCIALSASRAAVSKSKRLPLEEAQGLMHQLMQCQTPYYCPQGKPTIIQISNDELAKLFTKVSHHGS
jgi:DNA mismatch repair protein MutL